MNKTDLYSKFVKILKFGEAYMDEPMKKHTSFKIGGPVDVMVLPGSEEELMNSIEICKNNEIDYIVMGNGTRTGICPLLYVHRRLEAFQRHHYPADHTHGHRRCSDLYIPGVLAHYCRLVGCSRRLDTAAPPVIHLD